MYTLSKSLINKNPSYVYESMTYGLCFKQIRMNQHVNSLNNYGVNIFEECVRRGEVNGAELKAAF